MSRVKKILVIGAGVAGPSVCYWLKKYGFSPVLIENSPVLRKGGQALDIRGVAINLTKSIGIYDKIYDRRTRVECARYVDTQGKTLHEEVGEKSGFRQDEEVEIIRGDLVQILMNTIEGVPIQLGLSVQSILQNENGVMVHFKDGRSEQFDMVIGADGVHSATRRMVFAKDEYELENIGGYLSIFSIPNYLKLSHMEVLFDSDQKVVTITSDENPDVARAGFMFRSQHKLNDIRDKQEQMQFLRDTFHDVGWESQTLLQYMPESPDFYFDSLSQIKMNSWSKGRVVLLGDAGYCASPLSGQGNNLAMIGAYILAGELMLAEGDYQVAFQRYYDLMHEFSLINQDFAKWVNENYFISGEVSKEIAKSRANTVIEKLKYVSNALKLPEYHQ